MSENNEVKMSVIDSSRKYVFTGKNPEKYSGQVTSVITALNNIKEGFLNDFITEVLRVNPGYSTLTPINQSVKYHLHQLAKKGFVKEVNR